MFLACLLPTPLILAGVTVAVRFYDNELALPTEPRLSPEVATAAQFANDPAGSAAPRHCNRTDFDSPAVGIPAPYDVVRLFNT